MNHKAITITLIALTLAHSTYTLINPQILARKSPFCLFPEIWESDLQTVNTAIDFQRYQGKWYEIARLPTPFQEGCFCTEVQYTLQTLTLGVYNMCYDVNGVITEEARGFAVNINSAKTKNKVYFNIFGGNYWILDIGDSYDYGYVMVGEPCRDQLWILSRTKTLPTDLLTRLIKKAEGLGYNIYGLIARGKASFC